MQYDYDVAVPPPPQPTGPGVPHGSGTAKRKEKSPQEGVDHFWSKFFTKTPGKVTSILSNSPHAQYAASRTPAGVVQGQQAVKSYNEAYAECKRDVERTIRECRRVNQKYRDPHFDIELDLKLGNKNCLFGLNREDDSINPKGVKRVTVRQFC